MSWRLAKSLVQLKNEINAKWPDRSKDSDGTIGDTAHSARKSDHNPDDEGVVCALDITNDPLHGVNSENLANYIRGLKDPRVSYVISNKKIASEIDNWTWRAYTGSNPHDHHFHVSVKQAYKDDDRPWGIAAVKGEVFASTAPVMPLLRFGMQGTSVKVLQRCMGLSETGKFDIQLETAVKRFQTAEELSSDGIVGSYTWGAIMKGPLA